MKDKILVTGATGNVGGEIVRLLREIDADFVAATTGDSIEGVETVVLNFADQQSVEAALQGVSTLFMVLANHPDMIGWGENVIDAARKCGVKHIVRSAGSLADAGSYMDIRKTIANTDNYLKQSGINYTIAAPGFFMQNFINFHAQDYRDGVLYLPAAEGKVAWTDVRDIAAVNVAVLLEPEKYRNQTLVITGSEVLSYTEAVAVMNTVLGKKTQYIAVTDNDAIKAMTEQQFPEFLIHLMIELNQCIRGGLAEEVTTIIKDVTGKDAITFEQFVRDNKTAWL